MSAFWPIAQCLMVKLLIFINFYLKDKASFKGEVQMEARVIHEKEKKKNKSFGQIPWTPESDQHLTPVYIISPLNHTSWSWT